MAIDVTKSRTFVYIGNGGCVVGKQKVEYKPDVRIDIYGHTKVETICPVKRSLPHSFNLSMYPNLNEQDPASNIDEAATGVDRLFVESNKAAMLLICSALDILRKDFSWDNFKVFDDDQFFRPVDDNYQTDAWYDKKAVLTKDFGLCRKGDIVYVGDSVPDETEDRIKFWECRYRFTDNHPGFMDVFHRLWDKYFHKKRYEFRRKGIGTFNIPLTGIKFLCGSSVDQNIKK